MLKLIFCKIHDERTSDGSAVLCWGQRAQQHKRLPESQGPHRQAVCRFKADYATIFPANETVALGPPVLAYIVSQLQMYSLLESDVDVKGNAYEEIVGANLRGDRGEFFTPRNVCNMAVSMLDPAARTSLCSIPHVAPAASLSSP